MLFEHKIFSDHKACLNMHICIHSRKSGQYWSQSDEWTSRHTAARNFPTAAEAEKFCQDMDFADAEILIFRQGQPLVSIPVGKQVHPA